MTTRIQRRYGLVTAAYNEERYIGNLIESVVAQIRRPECWVIVSDGSTDRTDDIVTGYARHHEFLRLRRITEDHPRNFAAQVNAINLGFAELRREGYEFIGNLDADITLEPTYFAELLTRFDRDPGLGLAGGYIWEPARGTFRPRSSNSPSSVAHAIQLFRRECLEQIGGKYVPLVCGGPDWLAEVNARFHGWRVQASTDLKVYHHRPTGGAAGLLKTCYMSGLMDYALGSHPCFELFRVARRLRDKPYVLGSMVRMYAYVRASAQHRMRPVSGDMVKFLREYELARLRSFLRWPGKARLVVSSTPPGEMNCLR